MLSAHDDGVGRHSTATRAWVPVVAVGLCLTAVAGCTSSTHGVKAHEEFGASTSWPLVLDPPTSTAGLKVSRSAARHSVTHPFAAPQLAGGLKEFGLADVTASSLASVGTGPPPTYRHKLAWVGVYEISKSAETSCPADPGPEADEPAAAVSALLLRGTRRRRNRAAVNVERGHERPAAPRVRGPGDALSSRRLRRRSREGRHLRAHAGLRADQLQ